MRNGDAGFPFTQIAVKVRQVRVRAHVGVVAQEIDVVVAVQFAVSVPLIPHERDEPSILIIAFDQFAQHLPVPIEIGLMPRALQQEAVFKIIVKGIIGDGEKVEILACILEDAFGVCEHLLAFLPRMVADDVGMKVAPIAVHRSVRLPFSQSFALKMTESRRAWMHPAASGHSAFNASITGCHMLR